MPFLIENTRRAVLKLGTGILTTGKAAVDTARLARVGEQVAALRQKGIEIIIVSSGAVGLGMGRLGITRRPTEIRQLQACAAVGQAILMDLWAGAFSPHGIAIGQVLLTHDDVRPRARHLGVRGTLEKLLSLGVIPIINENDALSADELRFGDNDILSALVASLLRAEILVILSTVPGLIDYEGTGAVVPVVEEITPEIEAMAGGTTSTTAVGGMRSKIVAARVATKSGCGVFIGSGDDPALLLHLFGGRAEGTFFAPTRLPLHARKRWIAFFRKPSGTLYLDDGACRALRENGRSLLATGIQRFLGQFSAGDVLDLALPDGTVFARGETRYSVTELAQALGRDTQALRALFPGRRHYEVIHRDRLVLTR